MSEYSPESSSQKRTGLIEALIPERLRAVGAYHVQDSKGLLKLDAMENSFPLPPSVDEAFRARLASLEINRYPSPHPQKIEQQLRRLYGVHDETAMIFGNGSDELIQLLITVIAPSNRVVVAPVPSFVMYANLAHLLDCRFIGVPLQSDFSLDLAAMSEVVRSQRPGLVFLAQPNNPTGVAYSQAAVVELAEQCRESGSLLVIDEAYEAFTDYSAIGLEQRFENVLILRTLSKLGMAGARFGMLFGHEAWVREFDKARLPYNINVFSQLFIEIALEHYELFMAQTEALRGYRAILQDQLTALPWVKVFDSEANFVLIRVLDESAPDTAATTSGEALAPRLHKAMKQRGVLIKCLHGAHPLVENCLRLTVGQAHENEQMMRALIEAYQDLRDGNSGDG
ncbi:histidinol-phosphate transaminase [Allohahella marinimesophila]|uniref:Histidinol-phosphate aminotransferase n=1 Tax=Allohahella marinimesophila TaxID=1054972 RepID=A0ABP7PYR0_9GAMM